VKLPCQFAIAGRRHFACQSFVLMQAPRQYSIDDSTRRSAAGSVGWSNHNTAVRSDAWHVATSSFRFTCGSTVNYVRSIWLLCGL